MILIAYLGIIKTFSSQLLENHLKVLSQFVIGQLISMQKKNKTLLYVFNRTKA